MISIGEIYINERRKCLLFGKPTLGITGLKYFSRLGLTDYFQFDCEAARVIQEWDGIYFSSKGKNGPGWYELFNERS